MTYNIKLSFSQERKVTYHTAANIVYDPLVDGGHALAGVGAVTLDATTPQPRVALAGAGDRVMGQLVLVAPDGTCVVQVDGYATFAPGDVGGAAPNGAIMGDTLSAAPGYVAALAAADVAALIPLVGSPVCHEIVGSTEVVAKF